MCPGGQGRIDPGLILPLGCSQLQDNKDLISSKRRVCASEKSESDPWNEVPNKKKYPCCVGELAENYWYLLYNLT
jgi:hypothetical protein